MFYKFNYLSLPGTERINMPHPNEQNNSGSTLHLGYLGIKKYLTVFRTGYANTLDVDPNKRDDARLKGILQPQNKCCLDERF